MNSAPPSAARRAKAASSGALARHQASACAAMVARHTT
jgi:hypothetical protein